MGLYAMNDYVGAVEDLRATMAYGVPKQYPLAINGLFGLGVTSAECEKMLDDPSVSSKAYKAAGCTDMSFTEKAVMYNPSQYANPIGPQPQGPQGPQSKFAQNVNTVTDALTKLAATFAPAFSKPPRQKLIVQKAPDYTTYAVIAGAVVVASVLAIAVGKSGRRRDDK